MTVYILELHLGDWSNGNIRICRKSGLMFISVWKEREETVLKEGHALSLGRFIAMHLPCDTLDYCVLWINLVFALSCSALACFGHCHVL